MYPKYTNKLLTLENINQLFYNTLSEQEHFIHEIVYEVPYNCSYPYVGLTSIRLGGVKETIFTDMNISFSRKVNLVQLEYLLSDECFNKFLNNKNNLRPSYYESYVRTIIYLIFNLLPHSRVRLINIMKQLKNYRGDSLDLIKYKTYVDILNCHIQRAKNEIV